MDSSIRNRFLSVRTGLPAAASQGDEALENYVSQLASLYDDLQDAELKNLLSLETYTVAHQVVTQVGLLAQSFTDIEETTKFLTAQEIANVDAILESHPSQEVMAHPSPTDLQAFILPSYDWLLRNLHNPYPSSQTKATIAEESRASAKSVNDWFVNARRRLGWTAFVKGYFGGNAQAARNTIMSVLEGDDPTVPKPVRRAILELKEKAEGWYRGKLIGSQLKLSQPQLPLPKTEPASTSTVTPGLYSEVFAPTTSSQYSDFSPSVSPVSRSSSSFPSLPRRSVSTSSTSSNDSMGSLMTDTLSSSPEASSLYDSAPPTPPPSILQLEPNIEDGTSRKRHASDLIDIPPSKRVRVELPQLHFASLLKPVDVLKVDAPNFPRSDLSNPGALDMTKGHLPEPYDAAPSLPPSDYNVPMLPRDSSAVSSSMPTCFDFSSPAPLGFSAPDSGNSVHLSPFVGDMFSQHEVDVNFDFDLGRDPSRLEEPSGQYSTEDLTIVSDTILSALLQDTCNSLRSPLETSSEFLPAICSSSLSGANQTSAPPTPYVRFTAQPPLHSLPHLLQEPLDRSWLSNGSSTLLELDFGTPSFSPPIDTSEPECKDIVPSMSKEEREAYVAFLETWIKSFVGGQDVLSMAQESVALRQVTAHLNQ